MTTDSVTTATLGETGALVAPTAAQRARSPRHRDIRGVLVRAGCRLASPVILIALWQIASVEGWLGSAQFASPSQVWSTFTQLAGDGELLSDIAKSLERVIFGLLIGGSIAIVLGLMSGLSVVGESVIDPPLQMLRAMPSLGTAPLLVIWLGIDEGIKVGLVAISVMFPLYINLHRGIRGIDPRFRELSNVCGANRWQVITQVILPGALPSLLVGLRLSLGIAWLALVVGEGINAQGGIGYLISEGQNALQTNLIILALVLYAILGLLMECVVRLIERRVLRWRKGFLG